MRYGVRMSAVVTFGMALGCSDGTSAPPGNVKTGTPTVPASPPFVVRMAIVPDSAILPLSSAIPFAAYNVLSDSSRVPVNAVWMSNNTQVLMINPVSGYAIPIGTGHAVVFAKADHWTAAASVTVLPPTSQGTSDALVVDSFAMIEFQYPESPAQFYYAPQMRAHAAQGHAALVLQMRFSIPGLGAPPPFGCGAAISSAPRDLFGEVYGDWLLSIFGNGRRASGEAATATLTFVDDAGTTSTRVVTGPIVRGSLPSTYTGGTDGGACFHGYGSSG